MVTVEQVLSFWLDEVGPKGWYEGGETLDEQIRDRFLDAWKQAADGACSLWLTYPSGVLAYIILTDQFPRNMFRGHADSFATDDVALAAAKCAIDKKWDMAIDEPARQFFYLPLMHSENLCDQERCVRLVKERMPETGKSNLFHARAHREVIREFGRFPYRSAALSRPTTPPEDAYLAAGGYGHTVRQMQELAQAC
ncbi:DUF924 domain-containing protein [Lutimaribacter sp. EGI FJ00015]|uniref:DUF924 domain-containing protein n=1 Tax=Lutimaribacter degradans TaxID=2945989 RepID=A0ACC5ZV23_9RHOB|nr:DUF924 family protein [Lutimaribacter sp. EGI FJ00013]MCM2562177.1 DUF924 domain-containing protein [Lutimaribacter sp. EGI FJ00013]MCO0613331.1 DUF924 domain-containing protein [Lutimaribacter sp. EGI FJ00015]MCO0636306.1 DUF924 domain-containing protein [Lutimaribacter sp. EGI FJ00014]